jgi:hypothetical protein
MKKLYFAVPQGWQLDAVYYGTFDWRLFNPSLTFAYTPPHARLYLSAPGNTAPDAAPSGVATDSQARQKEHSEKGTIPNELGQGG